MRYYGAFKTAEEAHDALDRIYEIYRDRGNVKPEHVTSVAYEKRIQYDRDPKIGWNNPDEFRVVRNGKYWSIMTPEPSVITKIFSTTIRDPVNRPAHYISANGQMEVIDVIEAFTSDLQGIETVCTANAIKYILRWPHKENAVQDLKKAQWYLNRLINHISKEEL